MELLQGNTYRMFVKLKINCEPINIEDINIVQFVIGNLEKYYRKDEESEVIYDEEGKQFIITLTQEETYSLKDDELCQFRVKFTNDEVKGTYPFRCNVRESLKEVIL